MFSGFSYTDAVSTVRWMILFNSVEMKVQGGVESVQTKYVCLLVSVEVVDSVMSIWSWHMCVRYSMLTTSPTTCC